MTKTVAFGIAGLGFLFALYSYAPRIGVGVTILLVAVMLFTILKQREYETK